MRRTAPTKSAAASGEGRGALAVGKEERNVAYRTTGDTSSKAKPRRAKPPPRPSTGIPAGSSSVAVNAHVSKVLKAAMADDGLSPSTKVVCYWIAHHISRSGPRSGHAWPTVGTLQLLCGCKKRSVQNAVEALEEAGYMLRTVNAGRSSEGNDYQLRLPDGAPDWREKVQRGAPFNDQSETEKVHEAAPFNEKPDAEKVQDCDAKRCTEMHPILLSDTHKGPKGPVMDSSKHSTETSTSDARACAPGGATAASDSSDTTDTPDEPPPLEAYDDLPFEEQYDGDEGTPHPDIEPAPTATEEIDRHATAAPPAPIEDDDYFPHDLDEAGPEPEPAKPPPHVTYGQARVLHAVASAAVNAGHDPVGSWVAASVAADVFDDDEWFRSQVADIASKGCIQRDAASNRLAITPEGVQVLKLRKEFWPIAPAITMPANTKPSPGERYDEGSPF